MNTNDKRSSGTPQPELARVLSAIDEANALGLLMHDRSQHALSVLRGYSGKKLIGTLQRLCRLFPDDGSTCYLEIGVFQGLTLNHVASANPGLPCYGIDNFAYFDPDKKNLEVVQKCIRQLNNSNASVINADYEDALERLTNWIGTRRIGVLFVDGPHDYRSQLMCLQLALPYLHERGVIVIDDSNYEHVRQANVDFLRCHPEWALYAEAYTSAHPRNLSTKEAQKAEDGWWNGANVIGRDPESALLRRYPVTRRSRVLFENDHATHAHRLAPCSEEAIRLSGHLIGPAPVRAARALVHLLRKIRQSDGLGRFEELNTYSEGLPSFSLVPLNEAPNGSLV